MAVMTVMADDRCPGIPGLCRYNQLEQSEEAREEAREETGWKLVSGDVFRPPKYASLLAVYIGSGVQVLGMLCSTIAFATLGFLRYGPKQPCIPTQEP